MSEKSYLPQSISHKQLQNLLKSAQKEHHHSDQQNTNCSEELIEFEELLLNWSSLSKELIKTLKINHKHLGEGRKQRAMMALGALESHLRIALQAHDTFDMEN
ncbi:MATH domain-containing protein [Prochlorococcus sp. MIT 1300]|uniref:MATH domain-containing protein n=1 Tax=Prochlorococcus sp. MIT 1300 TaxID=3096218 RepID=UPI002A756D78|nr:MATH domain-containing protein [Prochlorococcus sp. MIT 1300]